MTLTELLLTGRDLSAKSPAQQRFIRRKRAEATQPFTYKSGHYSASGYRAYAVWVDGDIVGLVCHRKSRGQRDGDWTYETDGPSFQWFMTRDEAASALVAQRG